MKNKLCFKKYKIRLIKSGFIALILLGLCLIMPNVLFRVFCVMVLMAYVAMLAFDIYFYFSYPKKAEGMEVKEGSIFNWQPSGRKSFMASVTLKEDDKEYTSPHYFSLSEARDMVGKRVLYVVIEETLLIYEILN